MESYTLTFWWLFVLMMAGIAVWFFRAIHRYGQVSGADWKAQLEIVEYFSQSVFRQNSPEDILWDIAKSCIDRLGLEDCVIYLKDPMREVWIQKAAYGPKNINYRDIHEPIELPFDKGIVGRVGRTGIAEIVKDTSADPDYVVDDAFRGSELAVPILCDGEVIGVIDSEHTLPGFYRPFHLRVLQNVANICGQKIGRSLGEQRLAEYAKFFEFNPHPVARIRRDRHVLLANSAAEMAFGQEVVEGQTLSEDHPLWRALQGRKGSVEVVQLSSDDKVFQLTVVDDPARPFIHVYAVDVTELEHARGRASEAEQHKSDFLSVMSHEIRTPLNAILGLIELLMRGDANEEVRMSHLAYMEFAGRHLQGLLTDVLDLERLGSGRAQPQLVRFEIRELLKRVINGFEIRASSTGNALELEIDPSVPSHLVADVGWVTQMLNNLIANALKFTTEGSVTCLASMEGTDLVLTVSDTGRGIPQEDLQRILEPFEQSRREQINVLSQGVGLGLAITKRLIELHGGTLSIQSELQVGSSFVIRLPLQSRSDVKSWVPEESLQATAGAPIPHQPVLIVDDNELNVLVASRMVANWGYHVISAANADEAEAAMRESMPFVVLLDIHMPGRDGFQAAREWKSEESPFAGVSIVGLTADAESLTRERALEAGMVDVVVKPFNPPHLRSVLEHWAVHATG
jgi:signal transduction histidine kinase/CheY-like chemotaxis protein